MEDQVLPQSAEETLGDGEDEELPGYFDAFATGIIKGQSTNLGYDVGALGDLGPQKEPESVGQFIQQMGIGLSYAAGFMGGAFSAIAATGGVGVLGDAAAISPATERRLASVLLEEHLALEASAASSAAQAAKQSLKTIVAPKSLSAAAREILVKEVEAGTGDLITYGTLSKAKILSTAEIHNPELLADLGPGDWVRVYAMGEVEVLTQEGGRAIVITEVHWSAPRGQEGNLLAGKLFKRKED